VVAAGAPSRDYCRGGGFYLMVGRSKILKIFVGIIYTLKSKQVCISQEYGGKWRFNISASLLHAMA
jgi:hypothetical protein